MENTIKKPKVKSDMIIFLTIAALILAGIVFIIINIMQPDIAATINGEKVTLDEFRFQFNADLNQLMSQYQNAGDPQEFLNMPYGESTIKEELKAQSLNKIVQNRILLKMAKDDSFKAPDDEVNSIWDNFNTSIENAAKQYEMTVDEFAKQNLGTNMKNVEKFVKDGYIAEAYFNSKASEIEIDDENLKEFYNTYRQYFDTANVRHILIKLEDAEDEELFNEKYAIAEDVLNRAKAGEDFDMLIEEYSEDVNDGKVNNEGKYTVSQNGRFVAEFEAWPFQNEVGAMDIIKTSHGFHVMVLDELKNTFEDAYNNLIEPYKLNAFQETLNNKVKEYTIVTEDGYREL